MMLHRCTTSSIGHIEVGARAPKDVCLSQPTALRHGLDPLATCILMMRWCSSTSTGTTEEHLLGGKRITTDDLSHLISACDDTTKTLLVAVDGDGNDTHTVHGSLLIEKHGDQCHFGMLSVDPAIQNRGVELVMQPSRDAQQCED
jgi:hypothetical protein